MRQNIYKVLYYRISLCWHAFLIKFDLELTFNLCNALNEHGIRNEALRNWKVCLSTWIEWNKWPEENSQENFARETFPFSTHGEIEKCHHKIQIIAVTGKFIFFFFKYNRSCIVILYFFLLVLLFTYAIRFRNEIKRGNFHVFSLFSNTFYPHLDKLDWKFKLRPSYWDSLR